MRDRVFSLIFIKYGDIVYFVEGTLENEAFEIVLMLRNDDKMNRLKNINKNDLNLILIVLILIFSVGCSYKILFESLDDNSPYHIYGDILPGSIEDSSLYELWIFIEIDSSNYDIDVVQENEQ